MLHLEIDAKSGKIDFGNGGGAGRVHVLYSSRIEVFEDTVVNFEARFLEI